MRVIEQFTEGKTGDATRNEDRIVVTDHYACVLDGVTDKTGIVIDGESTGRFAVSVVADAIGVLPPEADFRTALTAMSAALDAAIHNAYAGMGIAVEPGTRPGLVVVVYARARNEIWRMGDGAFRIDDAVYPFDKKMDIFTSEARAVRLEMAVRTGMTVEDLRENDIGRAFIEPLLKHQYLFQNSDEDYGYGCLNGEHVPDAFLEVFDVPEGAKEIVLASDGYPEVLGTLDATEAALKEILAEDPMLFRCFKSTKGLDAGKVSFDDRSYLRLDISA